MQRNLKVCARSHDTARRGVGSCVQRRAADCTPRLFPEFTASCDNAVARACQSATKAVYTRCLQCIEAALAFSSCGTNISCSKFNVDSLFFLFCPPFFFLSPVTNVRFECPMSIEYPLVSSSVDCTACRPIVRIRSADKPKFIVRERVYRSCVLTFIIEGLIGRAHVGGCRLFIVFFVNANEILIITGTLFRD